jgi:hypothetical protein
MYGQPITDENCPTVAGSWALADETAMKCATTKQRSAANRTVRHSEEYEQDFIASQKASDYRPPIVDCIIIIIRKWRSEVLEKLQISVRLAKQVRKTGWHHPSFGYRCERLLSGRARLTFPKA